MDKLTKRQRNTAVSAYVLKLMVLLGTFNLASCSCKSSDNQQEAAPTLDSTDLTGTERELVFSLKNNADVEKDYSDWTAVVAPKVTAKSNQTATDGSIKVGSETGNTNSVINIKLKDAMGGSAKISPNASKDIKVELSSIDATKDDSAEVTVTIKDTEDKDIVSQTAKITAIS